MTSYRGAGVYVFRTRRPGVIGLLPWWMGVVSAGLSAAVLSFSPWSVWFSLLGLLFSSRHFAYVGESTAVSLRRTQHTEGGGRYKSLRKPWSDLSPSWYYLPLPGAPKWLLRSLETLLIALLWPVYNKQKNLWNPRRIPLEAAKRQAALRARWGWSLNCRPAHLVLAAALILIMKGAFT